MKIADKKNKKTLLSLDTNLVTFSKSSFLQSCILSIIIFDLFLNCGCIVDNYWQQFSSDLLLIVLTILHTFFAKSWGCQLRKKSHILNIFKPNLSSQLNPIIVIAIEIHMIVGEGLIDSNTPLELVIGRFNMVEILGLLWTLFFFASLPFFVLEWNPWVIPLWPWFRSLESGCYLMLL